MRRKAIDVRSAEELEGLTTKQLLARLDRLRKCETSASLTDGDEMAHASGIMFKATPEWASAYDQLKSVLARREHVPKGDELVERRKRRAKFARTTERKAGRQKR